jgi:hypothetical protein
MWWFAEVIIASYRIIDTIFAYSNISEGNGIQRSQTGSHC